MERDADSDENITKAEADEETKASEEWERMKSELASEVQDVKKAKAIHVTMTSTEEQIAGNT